MQHDHHGARRRVSRPAALFAALVTAFGALGASSPAIAAKPTPAPSSSGAPSPGTVSSSPGTGGSSGGAAASSGDATDPTGSSTKGLTFGIGPARQVPADQSVDGRPYLRYVANPGATINDVVAVLNLSDKPATFRVYATDAAQTSDGGFGLLPSGAAVTGPGSWFSLDLPTSREVTVPPRKGDVVGRVEIPFTAKVPADTAPGDHVAGVVASLETVSTTTDGARIRFDQRVGVRAYFRVSGPITPQLAVENVRTSYRWDPDIQGHDAVQVSYRVRNTGNVRMSATQLVDLDRRFRSSIQARPVPIPDLLPGSAVDVSTVMPTRYSALDVDALVSVFPTPVDPEIVAPKTFVQGEASSMAWQWPVIAVVTILLLIALIWWIRRDRARRRERRNRPGAPGSRRAEKGRRFTRRTPETTTTKEAEKAGVARSSARVVAILGLGLLGPLIPSAAHADVVDPDGGRLLLEAGQLTGLPSNALKGGVWGREGVERNLATTISADLTDGSGALTERSQTFWLKRLGVTDPTQLGIAFVRASKDGSTERPKVTKGDNAGQVFGWFTLQPFADSWVAGGQRYNDSVVTVHTLDEYRDWARNGRPDQVFDDNLVARDALVAGTPVSAHPRGKSIQNRWPAGTEISLVVFASDGFDGDGVPLVAVGDDGRARTAWLTFETEADPKMPSHTSGGYRVVAASRLPLTPSQVSKDPTAEVDGTDASRAAAGPSGSTSASAGPGAAGQDATSASGTGTDPGPGARAGARSSESSGSGWIWPTVAVGAALLVLGAVAFRRSARKPGGTP